MKFADYPLLRGCAFDLWDDNAPLPTSARDAAMKRIEESGEVWTDRAHEPIDLDEAEAELRGLTHDERANLVFEEDTIVEEIASRAPTANRAVEYLFETLFA